MKRPSLSREIVAIARHFGAFERESICCGDVTVQQCFVLQALLDEEQDVGTLARRAGSSASAMTRLVDGLVRRGWAERRQDPADRRRALVALTADGRAEAERLRELTEAGIGQVMRHIPEERRESVVEALRLVREALETMDAAGEVRSCC